MESSLPKTATAEAQYSALWDLLWNNLPVLEGLTTVEPFVTPPLHQDASFGDDDPMAVDPQEHNNLVTSIDVSQPCFDELSSTILGGANVLLVRQEYHKFLEWQTKRIPEQPPRRIPFVTAVLTGQPGIGERPHGFKQRFQAHRDHREELLPGLASLEPSGSWPTNGPPNHHR
jgi:hypothetical protein